MKKKIFLGGYVNYLNAQNINCKSIATHLDKTKYDVRALTLSTEKEGSLDFKTTRVYNNRFSVLYAFLSNILWADVAYLPKHQLTPVIALKISKLFKTKIFTTIEGNMCDTSKRSMINSFHNLSNMRRYFSLIPNIYGITEYIINNARCGVKLEKDCLFLGVEKDSFFAEDKTILKNIVFIGSLIRRKNIEEFFNLAKIFPNINFHVIGNKKYLKVNRERRIKNEIWIEKKNKTKDIDISDNVILNGKINREEMPVRLQEIDLLFLPSKSEGFPKIILEAAASGIPSIVYADYGASEWITTNKNGFVINSFDDAVQIVNQLIKDPLLLRRNSRGALDLAERFDWKKLIKNWERVIDNL